MDVLRCDNLDQHYGDFQALSGVTFVFPGGCCGLLGPNGAGKSTLMRSLLGQLPIATGRLSVAGADPGREPLLVRQRVGFMPESDAVLPHLSGLDFTAYCGELCGMRRVDAIARAHEVLTFVGLGEARYRALDGYSTGMRQRAKLAAALVHGPGLLLLDEPTNGLDPAGRDEMLHLVDDVAHQRGIHVLLSSHILPDIERTCDQVVVMNAGRVLFAGSRTAFQQRSEKRLWVRVKAGRDEMAAALRSAGCQVTAEPGAAHLEVELPPGAEARLIWRTARSSGLQVRSVAPAMATLEQAFEQALAGGPGEER